MANDISLGEMTWRILRDQEKQDQNPTTPPSAIDDKTGNAAKSALTEAATSTRELLVSATPALPSTPSTATVVQRLDVPTQKQTFYVEITAPSGKKEKFRVDAQVPTALGPETAKEFWESILRWIGNRERQLLPAQYETHSMFVDEDSLSVTKNGATTHLKHPEVAKVCHPYANGNRKDLITALKAFKSHLPAPTSSTISDINSPTPIEHEENTCYLAAATQALMNTPDLLEKLPQAIQTAGIYRKEALIAIQNLVNTYQLHKPVPGSAMIQLRQILGYEDTNQHDATEAFLRIETLISGERAGDPDALIDGNHRGASNGNLVLDLQKTPPQVSLSQLLKNQNDTQFLISPTRLNIMLRRYPENSTTKIQTSVQLPTELEIEPSRYVGDVSKEDRTYQLSTVILHSGNTIEGGHYTTLVRKLGSDRKFHSYLCDDMVPGETKELSQKDLTDLLQSREVYTAIYTKKETAVAAANRHTAPGSTPTIAAPEGEKTFAFVYDKENDRCLGNLHIKIGDPATQDKGAVVVKFTDENLSKIDEATKAIIKKNSEKWFHKDKLTAGEAGHTDTTIFANAGSSYKHLRDAITNSLKLSTGSVVIPLPTISGLEPKEIYNVIVDEATKSANAKPNRNIKILLTRDQEKTLTIHPDKEFLDTSFTPTPSIFASIPKAGTRFKWQPIDVKAATYREMPRRTESQHRMEVGSFYFIRDQEVLANDGFTSDFNDWMGKAIAAKKTKLAIVIRLDAKDKIDEKKIETILKQWVEKLSTRTTVFTYEDGAITNIDLIILPSPK